MTNATGPALTALAATSSGPYAVGEVIALTATFNVAVTVDTTGGTPRIPFTLGTATKHAAYHSGSGTTALVFRYTVAAGDADSDGITVAQNALALNGGTIGDSDPRTRRRSPTRRWRRALTTPSTRCARRCRAPRFRGRS